MRTVVLSLHDQATKLRYPDDLQPHIDLLFGPQAGDLGRRPTHVVTVQAAGRERYSVSVDSEQHAADLSLAELFDALLEEIVRSLIVRLDTAIALHCAAVDWGGKAILIPGPTGAGKTSLAGWMIANGFEFLSDELVVLTDAGGRTVSFPRPLIVKPGGEELVAMLERTGRTKTVSTGANTVVSLDRPSAGDDRVRHASLVIFPRFVPGSELDLTSVSPAMTGLKLMECNLNARNLADHGFATLSAFARNAPALALTYGDYEQLDGVADTFAKMVLDGNVPASALRKLTSAFHGPAPIAEKKPAQAESAPPTSPAPKPAPPLRSLRKFSRKLTIGMATYDDYDGVYFTLQALRLYHPEILDDIELVVIDNHPDGQCGQLLKNLEKSIPNYRYIPKGRISGTAASRNWIFEDAGSDFVLCIDCHVLIAKGALKRLIAYFDANPDSRDLLQGPLLYDDLNTIATHFTPDWRGGMYGTWDKSSVADDVDAPPFEIPMQGLGLFACRRTAWLGFNPDFRGFGGEEGYIHEKFRQAGGRTLCLPFLRWMHRFNRPMGAPYANTWEDRIRNYVIGFRELELDTAPMIEHFKALLGEPVAAGILEHTEKDLASTPYGRAFSRTTVPEFAAGPADVRRARTTAEAPHVRLHILNAPPRDHNAAAYGLEQFVADCRSILSNDTELWNLDEIRIRLEQLIANPAFVSQYCSETPPPIAKVLHEEAASELRILAYILDTPYVSPPHDHGHKWVVYGQVGEHTDITEWDRLDDGGSQESYQFKARREYRLKPGHARVFQVGDVHSIDCPFGSRYLRVGGTNRPKVI